MVLVGIRKQPKEEKAFLGFLPNLPFCRTVAHTAHQCCFALSCARLVEGVLGSPEAGPELRVCVQRMYLGSQKGVGGQDKDGEAE